MSFGTNLFFLGAITDRGFAGGASSLGGVIYDSHGSKVELFDEWWATKFRAAPLPAHVRRVRDLQEHAGDIYCLIDLENQDTGYVTSALAIAPLKQGKKK